MANWNRLPPEMGEWLEKNASGSGKGWHELSREFNEHFGVEFSEKKIVNIAKRRRIHTGVHRDYPEDLEAYLKDVYQNHSISECRDLVQETYGTDIPVKTLKAWAERHGIKSGRTGRFETGHCEPWLHRKRPGYRTASMMRKGHEPHNKAAVGSLRERTTGVFRKMPDGTWKREAVRVWEEAHGKVPDGYWVLQLDGNRWNNDISNLRMISKRTLGPMNKSRMLSSEPDVTETRMLLMELKIATNDRKYGRGRYADAETHHD